MYESLGLAKKDENKVKKEIELHLRVDRLIRDIIKYMPATSTTEDKNLKIGEFIRELRASASITFVVDEKLKAGLAAAKLDIKKTYKKPLNFLLVKPAGPECNMACTYCFYLKKQALFPGNAVHRMTEQALEEMIRQAMSQSGDSITFGWQGGEPTLMGLPFFRKVIELQKKYGKSKTIGNGFQTNGLLVDREWARFFKENCFLIGLSLDGPEHIHDRYRKNRGGQGTWRKVVENARLLLGEGVATNALSVVNDYSVKYAAEIYHFHKSLGLNFMQFIPCVETDPLSPDRAAPFSVSAEGFGMFLCALFNLWKADFTGSKPSTSIRFFDSVFFTYVDMMPPECTLLKECGVYLVVEHNGAVYPCDFFVEPQMELGNVMSGQLIDMLNSSVQEKFGLAKQAVADRCKQCNWQVHCRGGCPKDRIRDSRDSGLSHFCESYRIFFSYAHEDLCKMAAEWKRKHAQSTR